MASRTLLENAPKPVNDDVRSFTIPATFSIREVDGRRGGPGRGRGPPGRDDRDDRDGPPFGRGRGGPGPQIPIDPIKPPPPGPAPPPEASQPLDDSTLGPVLGKFVGTFKGTGIVLNSLIDITQD